MSKSKWKVQCNFVAGVGKMYRAVRIIDPNVPEHSGNLEAYGAYCEDREAVAATVKHLNEQEKVEPRESLKVCTCPICGTKFVPTSEWHWTHGKFKFCRYHCYLKRESLAKPKNYRPERRVRQFALTGEIVATYENAKRAAEAIGYPASTIRTCCRKRQPMGTGYRWEYIGSESELSHRGMELDTAEHSPDDWARQLAAEEETNAEETKEAKENVEEASLSDA